MGKEPSTKWVARGSATTASPTMSTNSRQKRARKNRRSRGRIRRTETLMRRHWAVSASFLLVCASSICVSAQVRYARGQNVAPVFEGWEHNPDGTYSMVFGYLNRNYEEELDIPVGPDNAVALGGGAGGDRGQPEHFYPRRQRFLFKVVVPGDWDKTQKVVWTLTSRGRTDQAKGWLQPEWELSEGVIIENLR